VDSAWGKAHKDAKAAATSAEYELERRLRQAGRRPVGRIKVTAEREVGGGKYQCLAECRSVPSLRR
jgi:hypothetical protein